MRYPRKQSNLAMARSLRWNMTPQERRLWYDFLRYCKPRFRRQEIIGPYVADFFCYDAKLIIEIDGSQHFSPEMIAYDNTRTDYFHTLGIRLMRIDNGQINRNFKGECEGVILAMQECGFNTEINVEA